MPINLYFLKTILYELNGGPGAVIFAIIVFSLLIIFYLIYSRHLGKKYILECATCGNKVKKKYLFLVNQSHNFYKTKCGKCRKKRYFTIIEDK